MQLDLIDQIDSDIYMNLLRLKICVLYLRSEYMKLWNIESLTL